MLPDIIKPQSKGPDWVGLAYEEADKRATKIINEKRRQESFAKFRDNPIGFCEYAFGETYTDDVRGVAESVRDNVVTIARSANAIGKSHVAARLALWFWSVYPEAKVYMTAAPPLENLRLVLWGELMTAARKKPSIVYGCKIKSGNQLLIYKNAESFITGMAVPTSGTAEEREAKFSGRHSPHLMFIIDEGDAVPDEIYRGIDSCMSGGEVARLLIMFNPRASLGPVYMKESHGQANVVNLSAIRHPNVIKGTDVIPGAVTRETTIRRIHTWTRALAPGEAETEDCWHVPDFLADQAVVGLDGKFYPPLDTGQARKITEPAFSYMVLGEYPAHGVSQLVSEEWISAARSRWDLYVSTHGEVPPQEVNPIMGLDMAEYGTDSNCAFLRYGGYVAKPEVWGGMDVDMSTHHALDIYLKNHCQIVMVDATGIGSSVAPSMARRGRTSDVRAVSVKVGEKPSPIIKSDLGEFQYLKDQLYWAMREWFRTGDAMIPPDPMLIEELKAVTYEVSNRGKIQITEKKKLRERLKRSPDRADALALTFVPVERPHWIKLGEG